jgi:hypothetical protein
MESDEKRQVSRGRRGSNETELVLVGVGSGKTRSLYGPSIPHAEAGPFASWTLLEPYAIRGRHVNSGGKEGSKSVDQALQLREHMALGNVIRLEGHWVHIIWGGTVDVLTHDERDGETDNQAVSAVYPYAERRESRGAGHHDRCE